MIELLAPAGSFDFVKPIIDSGVDAVYLGLRDFNARMRAKNFSIDEIAATLDYCRIKNVKLYLTLNTLIKESELKKLIEYLTIINSLKVDAVIIQDLGVLNIVNRLFPELTVHASTQMFLFDEFSLEFAANNNIKRVILPRELSYNEIARLNDKTKIDLEIFIHGSMCYSISGNCYFSHYLGGFSGNRGECRQPCRKKFVLNPQNSKINSDSINSDFPYFSLNDLCYLEHIPQLLKLDNLKSFKIEGRLKSPDYLLSIISIYKNVINAYYHNPDKINEIIEVEKNKLYELGSREFSSGYYFFPDTHNIFCESNSDLYKKAGDIITVKGKYVHLKVIENFKSSDLFKIQKFGSEKRQSLKIYNLTDKSGNNIQQACAGDYAVFETNIKAGKSDLIFVMNSSPLNFKKLKTPRNAKIQDKIIIDNNKFELDRIIETSYKSSFIKTKFHQNNFEYIYQNDPDFISKLKIKSCLIIELDLNSESTDSNIIELDSKNVIVSIPCVIDSARELKKRSEHFINSGIKHFMLSHISQVNFFDKNSREKIFLYAGWRINVLNSMSADFLLKLGFSGFTFSIEDNYDNYSKIKSPIKRFVFIKFQPPLFISRAINSKITGKNVLDESSNKYFIIERNNLLNVFPEKKYMIDYEKQFYKDNSVGLIKERNSAAHNVL